jgi:hypothetical protein
MQNLNNESALFTVIKKPAHLRAAVASLLDRETRAMERASKMPGFNLAPLVMRRARIMKLLIMVNSGAKIPPEAYTQFQRLMNQEELLRR